MVRQSGLVSLAFWLFAAGAIPLAAQEQVKSTLLQGSVQHSENLPPLKLEEITKQFSLRRDVDLATPPPQSQSRGSTGAEPGASVSKPKKESPTQPALRPVPAPAVKPGKAPAAVAQVKPRPDAQSNLTQFNSKFAKVPVAGGYFAVVPIGTKEKAVKLQGLANKEANGKAGQPEGKPAHGLTGSARETGVPIGGAAGAGGQPGVKLGALALLQSGGRTKLKAGAQVNASPSQRRYEVPMWLAGVWQRKQAMETSRTQLPSGRQQRPIGLSIARVTDNFGTVKDKEGHIYQLFDPEHSTGQVDRGNTIDLEHVFDYRLQILDEKRVLVVARAWHAQLKKSNHQVVSAYQDEEFNTYTSLQPGYLRTDSSVKVFDVHGKPTLLTKSVSNEVRIQGP